MKKITTALMLILCIGLATTPKQSFAAKTKVEIKKLPLWYYETRRVEIITELVGSTVQVTSIITHYRYSVDMFNQVVLVSTWTTYEPGMVGM